MCAVAGALAGLGVQTWLLQVGGAALEFLVQDAASSPVQAHD